MGYADWGWDADQPAKSDDQDWSSVPGDFDTIPVIDVSRIRSDDIEERKKVAAAIREACIRVGFFYIENHGIPQELVDNAFKASKHFFSRPFEEKMQIFIDNSPNFRGYTPIGGSGKPDANGKGNLNEGFDYGLEPNLNDDPSYKCDDPEMGGVNQWPKNLPDFEAHISAYFRELRSFSRVFVRILALSLGLSEDRFDPHIAHAGISTVLAHYPPQDQGSSSRGLDAHTDAEFFTILEPGPVRALEVANKAGQWISAPYRPGTFIFNVGDQLQIFSNDLYVSTRHRVMNYSGEERYSIPFFFSANYETVIKPFPELIKGDHVSNFPPVSAGKLYKDNMSRLHRISHTVSEFAKYRHNHAIATVA